MIAYRLVLVVSALLLFAAIGSLPGCSSSPSSASMVATLAVKDCEKLGYPEGHAGHFDCLAVTMPARVSALPGPWPVVGSPTVGSRADDRTGAATWTRPKLVPAARGYKGVTGPSGSISGYTFDGD